MKKLLSIFAACAILGSFAGCSNLSDVNHSKVETQAAVTGRVAFADGLSEFNLKDISLSGVKDGKSYEFGKWETIADPAAASVKVPVGSWQFNLVATQDGIVYTGTTDAVVEAGKTTDLTFTVTQAVLMNGKAYATIKAAFAAVPSASRETYTIVLEPGVYNENYIHYNGSATIKVSGKAKTEGGIDVVVTGHGENMGKEKGRELLEFEGTGNLILEYISLISDYSREVVKGDAQAEVLGFDSTGKVAAYSCTFLSHQDTMRTTGKGWFYDCIVAGDTDFIWMESAGVTALYEDCEIVSLYDEFASTHASYILAPRANVANTMGKGAVIFNSLVAFQNDSTFLFRNPWGTNKDYYNQGAFINNKYEVVAEKAKVEKDLAKSAAMGTPDQAYVGWKIDASTVEQLAEFGTVAPMASIGIVSDDIVAKEYSGRDAILNRLYSVKYEKFSKDAAAYWDLKAFAEENGWEVSEDTSSALLEGEEEPVVVVYPFDGSVDQSALCTGFALQNGKTHYVGQADATITIPVTGKATVSVTGYYAGSGDIVAGTQGPSAYDFNNGSTSKLATKDYVVYQADAANVVIKATATTYITNVTVTYDNDIAFKPVTDIALATADNADSVLGLKELAFTATVTPANASNTEYVWSVDCDESVATINKKGVLVAADVEEAVDVTVTCTAKDEAACSVTKVIKVKVAPKTNADLTWFTAQDTWAGETSNAKIATAGDAVGNTTGNNGATGTWKYNSSKLTSGMFGYTLTTTDAEADPGEWYVEYPVTAVQKDMRIDTLRIWWGNSGTGNVRAYVTFIDENDVESVIYDKKGPSAAGATDFVTPRNSVDTDSTFDIYKTVSAGKTAKIRVSIHGLRKYWEGEGEAAVQKDSYQTFEGKAPTWSKTVVSVYNGPAPVVGQTYEYNFSKAPLYKDSGETEDEFVRWDSHVASGHGIEGGWATIMVNSNVKVSVGLCQFGNGVTIKVVDEATNVEVASYSQAKPPINACYSKGIDNPEMKDDNSFSFNYTGVPTTLKISGYKYLEGLKVEPLVN